MPLDAHRSLGLTALASVLVLHATAASAGPEPAPPTGFIGDYGLLETHEHDPLVRVYMKGADVLARYDRFIVGDAELLLVPGSRGHDVDPAQLEQLGHDLAAAFREQLSGAGYRLVNEASGRTAVVRLALTDVQPVGAGPRAGKLAAGAAAGLVVPGAGFLLPRFKTGRAAIELEVLDAETGEVVAAAMATDAGRAGGGPKPSLRQYRKWGDVQAAFDTWARQFRQTVDVAHGRR